MLNQSSESVLEDDASPNIPARRSPPQSSETRTDVHNFLTIALHQVLIRTGWIFKTESIIMPAVLDTISGAGWLRGCLPMLNRFGQSVPPVLFSPWLRSLRQKKWALSACVAGMSITFLSLASLWLFPELLGQWWVPAVFLLLYALFFSINGMMQLSMNTLHGKLVETTWRGRLMTITNLAGAVSAITCAALLLPLWLTPEEGQFQWIFGFAGIAFGVAAIVGMLLKETPDHQPRPVVSMRHYFGEAMRTMRTNQQFRRVAIVGSLFGTTFLLFPHYQALGRDRLGLKLDNLIWWVIVQNFGTGAFSLLAGPIADWRGNRATLRIVLLCFTLVPLSAIALASAGPQAAGWYWIIFLFVGLTPVTLRIMNNYTLELAPRRDHPQYLSAMGLCVALPICCSPLVGLAVDLVGYETVFIGVASMLFVGWLLTWRLYEPRHHLKSDDVGLIVDEKELQ